MTNPNSELLGHSSQFSKSSQELPAVKFVPTMTNYSNIVLMLV